MRLPDLRATSIFPIRLAYKLEFSRENCSARTCLCSGFLRSSIVRLREPAVIARS